MIVESIDGVLVVLIIEDDALGALLGTLVGEALRVVLGIEDGATDGAMLDRIVGEALGSVLGIEDGATDGALLG